MVLITRPIQSLLNGCSRDESRHLPNDQKTTTELHFISLLHPHTLSTFCCSSLVNEVSVHPDVSICLKTICIEIGSSVDAWEGLCSERQSFGSRWISVGWKGNGLTLGQCFVCGTDHSGVLPAKQLSAAGSWATVWRFTATVLLQQAVSVTLFKS